MSNAGAARLERLLGELDERNHDNVARTDSYLELYSMTCERGADFPWLLLAHLVSRNAGYMMTAVARSIDDERRGFSIEALEQLFLFLERANYLIFYDAWHHVLMHLLGRTCELQPPRVSSHMCAAYQRHGAAVESAEAERALVVDLVTNEQNLIEHRVVHHARFEAALALVTFFEAVGADRSLVFGETDSQVRVRRFERLERRIDAGMRMFDTMLADRSKRRTLHRWATGHPHTGSRSDYGGRTGPPLRDVWPRERVRALDATIHAAPAPDPTWT